MGEIPTESNKQKDKVMSNFTNTIEQLGFTHSLTIARTGSKYYMINGVQFRISDHQQPSHYQSKQYFDVDSEDSIINIISSPLFGKSFNPSEEDGVFYNAIYNSDIDGFSFEIITQEQYNEFVLLKENKKQFYLENGWAGDIY